MTLRYIQKIASAQWRPEVSAEERQRFGKSEFFFFSQRCLESSDDYIK